MRIEIEMVSRCMLHQKGYGKGKITQERMWWRRAREKLNGSLRILVPQTDTHVQRCRPPKGSKGQNNTKTNERHAAAERKKRAEGKNRANAKRKGRERERGNV